MKVTKAQLKKRLKKASEKVVLENNNLINTQQRKNYWQKLERELKYRLKLVTEGQIEMDI
jgi:hypothetical protein